MIKEILKNPNYRIFIEKFLKEGKLDFDIKTIYAVFQPSGKSENYLDLSSFRIPKFCEKCGKIIKNQYLYIKYNQCEDCYAEFESKLVIFGLYEYHLDIEKLNYLINLKENLKVYYEKYLENLKSKILVNQFGDIEDWEEESNERIEIQKQKVDKIIKEIETEIDKLKEKINNNYSEEQKQKYQNLLIKDF